MTRCHICRARCEYEFEPAIRDVPALTVPDVWTVAMGNGIYVDACQSCWQKWPWEHRLYPPVGFGRTKAASGHITMDELIELLAA